MNINSLNLNKIGELYNKNSLGLFEAKEKQETGAFHQLFIDAIKQASQLDAASADYSTKLASGQLENIHEAMIAAQKAELSMQLVVEVRNKILEAYREITRMQI
jgi:flagellar hook-basal body complex protein FliE